MKKTAIGCLFLAKDTGRVLLLMRNTHTYKNQYGLVGGKVKKGEIPIEGLFREISEEIGFLPDILKFIRMDEFVSQDSQFNYYSMLIIIKSEFIPILNKESSGYAWASLDCLPRPLHPRLKEMMSRDYLITSIKEFI